MSTLAEIQRSFASYLQGGDAGVAEHVIDDVRLGTQLRLEIYKSAYRIRLTKCIEGDHPVLCSYLGDELFELLAAGYITHCPSTHPSLRYFCERLPAYLRETEPFSQTPILAEIAALERTLMGAFDAPDGPVAGMDSLQAIAPEDWPDLRVCFHPGVRLFATRWNTIESWQALKQEHAPPPAEQNDEQHWLIWRGRDRLTQFRSLAPAGLWFYDALQSGGNLATACEALLEILPQDAISETTVNYLTGWLESGLISTVSCKELSL
jgi:hypothetical protein